jgi:multiple sugar transport system permease protein
MVFGGISMAGSSSEKQGKQSPSFGTILIYLILIGLGLIVILPLILPFLFAFKTQLEFTNTPWAFPPKHFIWSNLQEAWDSVQIGQGMLNSFIVCAGAILTTVPPAAMAGYIFARYRSRLTDILFYVVMAGFFVPVQMVLIPLVRISIAVHLADTLPGLFLPMAAFGIPFWTMIYRSFFMGQPTELMEAAKIDGADHFKIFSSIMLPLAAPATVLALLLTFMGAWNDYLLGLIMINSQDLFTVQLRVAQFLGALGIQSFPRFASGVIISAAPTVILYIVFHKWIIQGTTLSGALKG